MSNTGFMTGNSSNGYLMFFVNHSVLLCSVEIQEWFLKISIEHLLEHALTLKNNRVLHCVLILITFQVEYSNMEKLIRTVIIKSLCIKDAKPL